MSRFLILTGPSCIGKGPLYKALKQFYPDLASRLNYLVCYDSRAPRPGEREEIDFIIERAILLIIFTAGKIIWSSSIEVIRSRLISERLEDC